MVFERSSTPDHEALNLAAFSTFLSEVDGGTSLILNKIQGVSHGGGAPVPAGSAAFAEVERFLGKLDGPSALFGQHISESVVQSKCIACHVEGGVSGNTRLVFAPSTSPDHEALNLAAFEAFLSEVESGASLILSKIQGVSHGGGAQVPAGTAEFAQMERFLGKLDANVVPAAITVETLFDPVRMAPLRKTLRRAALIFAGRIPTDEEYASIYTSPTALRATIRNLMTGPEFHEFITRAANDRLLTERNWTPFLNDESDVQFVEFINEAYRRKKPAFTSGDQRQINDYWEWNGYVQFGVRRAPLELIAHVVENDRPYTEILTADYIMANPFAARAYGASTVFSDPEDPHEFKPSRIESYYRVGPGFERERHPDVMVSRILNRGSLSTDFPHAGILNTKVFMERYPTTATNRNRARARWTYYHFLGVDIEKSASRTTDPVALADTNNPTMHNPACTVCHTVMDPVAGAFQNYGDEGLYKNQWGGVDSLDRTYKEAGGEEKAVQAESWEERETLSWPLFVAAGTQTMRVTYTNHFWDEAVREGGVMNLDRLDVLDDQGRRITSVEFEDVDVPVAPWGDCGTQRRNSGTGSGDYLEMWGGYEECALRIEFEAAAAGAYTAEVIAWSNGHDERYGDGGYAKLGVAVNAYEQGDTWYRDMRAPGFAGELAPNSDNSLQWLARQIVADPRFAEATVKFWWPALMGSEVAEPPAEQGDADFEGQLLAANSQGAEVRRLSDGFRQGFNGGARYNLKDLLVEMVLSDWFRAGTMFGVDPIRQVALRDAGAKRILVPEELARKTAAITGIQWGRETPIQYVDRGQTSALTDEYRLVYGGIDSDGVTDRAREITSVMAGVAKRHAARVSCAIVMRELFLIPESERRLFSGIELNVTPGLEFSDSFEIEAASGDERETLSLQGSLPAGASTVRLTFTNEYWSPESDSNIHLDRLDVRDAAGQVVASYELETVEPEGNCKSPNGDNFALWCNSSLDVPINVSTAGQYTIEVVAWADQAGDELARLDVAVLDPTHSGAGASVIRGKLAELHESLFGVEVTPYSPNVDAAFQLFVEEIARSREAQDSNFNPWECDWAWDQFFFEGILDGALVEYENEDGYRWYNYDWNRLDQFMQTKNWSDHHYTAQAWTVVLAYLLMDYRYLYL